MTLPLYSNSNYKLNRECPELVREVSEQSDGKTTVGWELAVPERGADGFPYAIIFAGPSPEERGSAVRVRLVTRDGADIADDARVVLEAVPPEPAGGERLVAFEGPYKDFKSLPDQFATDAALSCQGRVEAGEHYRIRLTATVPSGGPLPDPDADDSFFEVEVFKHWRNFVA